MVKKVVYPSGLIIYISCKHLYLNLTYIFFFRPSIRFSSDETVASRMATNEIQFFDAGDFSKGMVHKIRIPGIAAAELSKQPGSHVAVFVPESKVCHYNSILTLNS